MLECQVLIQVFLVAVLEFIRNNNQPKIETDLRFRQICSLNLRRLTVLLYSVYFENTHYACQLHTVRHFVI